MKTLSKFEQIAKKNKRRTVVLVTVLSVLLTLVILLISFKIMSIRTWQSAEETRDYYDRMHKIAYPNVQYNYSVFEPTSEFSGYYYLDRVKNIAGIKVPYEDINAPYGAWKRRSYINGRARTDTTPYQTATYTLGSGYKSPMFYNTSYDYNQEHGFHMKKTQDIAFLPQMKGYAVEMAVTFDKSYTLEEITNKIPEQLMVNWYWIGTDSNLYDTAMFTPEEQIGFSLNPYLVRDGKDSTDKEKEDVWQMSYQDFTENLQLALDRDWLNHSLSTAKGEIYSQKKEVAAYLKANPDVKTARFSGVILTGRAEDFSDLEGKEWIFASNIGESILIHPYHQLQD
ncbi:hypothetical protein ABID29_002258 [Streptococcus rupicaprae]|uniref:Sigma factor regulator C-terminal domain-containing protein n=1 Tax=Streptococcus rupicaprae TaxID=759619 RepID=A0ABV2FKK1_9STRE